MNKKINLKCYFLYRELSTRINMHRYSSNIIWPVIVCLNQVNQALFFFSCFLLSLSSCLVL